MDDRPPATDGAADTGGSAGDGSPPGSVIDGADGSRAPVAVIRRLAAALVLTPGRSAAIVLTVGPYLWLAWYLAGTALGLVGDPIIAGDWLTLAFSCYALVFPLALAHRTLQVGLTELTQEYLVDIVALVWLTAFYVVWMLVREPVDPATTTTELYGPVVAGEPMAVQWAAAAAAVAVLVTGLSADRNEGSALFRGPFRTTLITVPGVVTVLVLTTSPGPESLLWPVVGGAFAGTLLAGVRHLPTVASGLARAAFVCLAAAVWFVGAGLWMVVHGRPPPTRQLLLGHVDFGLTPETGTEPGTDEETETAPDREAEPGDADAAPLAADGGHQDEGSETG